MLSFGYVWAAFRKLGSSRITLGTPSQLGTQTRCIEVPWPDERRRTSGASRGRGMGRGLVVGALDVSVGLGCGLGLVVGGSAKAVAEKVRLARRTMRRAGGRSGITEDEARRMPHARWPYPLARSRIP